MPPTAFASSRTRGSLREREMARALLAPRREIFGSAENGRRRREKPGDIVEAQQMTPPTHTSAAASRHHLRRRQSGVWSRPRKGMAFFSILIRSRYARRRTYFVTVTTMLSQFIS